MIREDYSPRRATAQILDRAYSLVQSVPYQVSARWLFYRLLQEGYYSSKDDYSNKFLKAVSAARHAFYKNWRPDTLADETREADVRGGGFEDMSEWLRFYSRRIGISFDKWQTQENYVELWFEARAMADQFRHYTENITLVPMGGQPSIPHKYEAAQRIDRAARKYDLPVYILYFGDLDPAGSLIAEVVERDVRTWSETDFEFVHCGLTQEQVDEYNVPENIEHPGAYQWEALSDEGARDIITENVSLYVNTDLFTEVEEREDRAEKWIREHFSQMERDWEE